MELEQAPIHLRETHPDRMINLRRWANSMACQFGGSVYLCGSALEDDNPDPRDWDIRMCLSDKLFASHYSPGMEPARLVKMWRDEFVTGKYDIRWKWSKDLVKYSYMGGRNTCLNVDFQVYPDSYWHEKFANFPKYRLDTMPESLLQPEY